MQIVKIHAIDNDTEYKITQLNDGHYSVEVSDEEFDEEFEVFVDNPGWEFNAHLSDKEEFVIKHLVNKFNN